jgi:uncharacterized iron-regulated membrane protein
MHRPSSRTPEPAVRRLRRLWLDVHLWIGAGLLLVLAPLSLSGAILVWRGPLDHALNPERYAISGAGQLPVGAYAAAAQAAFADRAQMSQLRLPPTPGDPVVAVGQISGPPGPGGRPRTLNAWIDPPTGRVLGVGEVARGFSMTLHRLHGALLIPGVGRKVVGWLGWAMFVSCATGLWLWWPRFGGFLSGLRWRRGTSQIYNLHHTLGFWICLPLAVLSLTGVFVSFPQTALRLTGQPPPPARAPRNNAPPPPAPRLTPDEAVAAAVALHPGEKPSAITWPQAGRKPAWRVELAEPAGAPVEVDDATGAARAAHAPPGGGEPSGGLASWMRGVHDGSRLGVLWRWAITLAGAAPAVLGVTGIVMWLRRR